MTEKEKALDILLDKISDELNITKTMQEKAVRSYEFVGKWLSDGIDYDVKIMPQGSMNLGTIIRPIDESDDYDIDLVCLLKDGTSLTLSRIKNIVGERLKEHSTFSKLLEPEKRRCWTMQYDEFHMDILPCVPAADYYIEPLITSIKLTHKNDYNFYEPRFSDPYAYHTWFEERMNTIGLTNSLSKYSATDIEDIPTYRKRTPLQKVIQLLKRHRDIMFQHNTENAPISIIITTLAAKAYNGETSIYEALRNILCKMPQYIENRNGVSWISNPVMEKENFADKWQENPEKRTNFFEWLKCAQSDLISSPQTYFGIDTISSAFSKCLGTAPVNRAIKKIGEKTKSKREQGLLFIDSLTGELSLNENGNKKIKDHTFYGI